VDAPDIQRSSTSYTPDHPTPALHTTLARLLLGALPRTAGHGVHGGGRCRILWTSRRGTAAETDVGGHGAVLWRMVLCATGQSKACWVLARKAVIRMRVERERELRRRRKRHEKARKERRKEALLKAGKWPLTPTKA